MFVCVCPVFIKMSLLTLERTSPSPHESVSPFLDGECVVLKVVDLFITGLFVCVCVTCSAVLTPLKPPYCV